MARKSVIYRELKRIKIAQKFAEKRKQIKKHIRELLVDPDANHNALTLAYKQLRAMPRDASPSRIRNRCRITGRSRGVYRKVKLARSMFREHAMQGEIPGVMKSSW